MEASRNDSASPLNITSADWQNLPRTLIVGYGNPDRQDDGVAWQVLHTIAQRFQIPISSDTDLGIFPEGNQLDFWFNLQLMPEMAPDMVEYERICFIDAHTGAIPQQIRIEPIQSKFQNSPLTHHLTPETIVSMLEHLYQHTPQAILVSIRGYQFRFERSLSPETYILSQQAAERIIYWILSGQIEE